MNKGSRKKDEESADDGIIELNGHSVHNIIMIQFGLTIYMRGFQKQKSVMRKTQYERESKKEKYLSSILRVFLKNQHIKKRIIGEKM